MMEQPRFATSLEDATLQASARSYVATVMEFAKGVYGADVVDQMSDEAKTVMVMTISVQSIMSPAALQIEPVDLDQAAFGLGIGMGLQTINVPEQAMHQILEALAKGVFGGRAQCIAAAMSMPTAGGMQ